MNPFHPVSRRSVSRRSGRFALFFATLAIGLVGVPTRSVRADDPPPEGGDPQAKVEAKMKEIVRLMRENGQAILEASKGGTSKPKGVTVEPPPAPPGGVAPPGGTPPPPDGTSGGMEGGAPGGTSDGPNGSGPGGEIRRRMEEIVEQASKTSASIPRAIEELIRMIPKKKSGPPSGGSGQPGSDPRGQRDPNKPGGDEPKTGEKDEPKPSERDPKSRDGDKPPADAERDRPKDDDTPAWAAELPPEVRRSAVNADLEKVPPEYREKLIRYQKWLLERAAKARDGR